MNTSKYIVLVLVELLYDYFLHLFNLTSNFEFLNFIQ